jgi:hypothetical protein
MGITQKVILATIAILVIYDIWAVITGGVEKTLSYVTYITSQKHPIIAFLAGMLCWHLFACPVMPCGQ